MEFTPKKQIIPSLNSVRHTPYSNAGQSHYKRLRRINTSASPRSSSPGNTPAPFTQKRFSVDKERINLTTRIIHPDAKVPLERKTTKGSSPKTIKTSPSTKTTKSTPSPGTKRPFSAVNGVESIKESALSSYDWDSDVFEDKKENEENDPYNFSASLDLDACDKRPKGDSDKENTTTSLLGLPRVTVVRSYPSKKKQQVDVSRSRLLADISPEKVEKAYGINYGKSEAEKENVPTETTSSGELVPLAETTPVVPHLIGFPNYGNTCYLNSVIQALFGLSPFVDDLQRVSPKLSLPTTSLSAGLSQVIGARTKGQAPLVKQSLKMVKENLVRVDGSFSGYKMQDANEFLTRILDTIKDEIDRCIDPTTTTTTNTTTNTNRCTTTDEFDKIFPHKRTSHANTDNENCESELSVRPKDHNPTIDQGGKTHADSSNDRGSKTHADSSNDSCVCTKVSSDGESDPLCVSPSHTHTHAVMSTNKPSDDCEDLEGAALRNPIKDNFEFQLFESYRCDGCSEVEGKKQEYFGLYVNLPEENGESIQEALSSCMGEDERELKCNKCGHNRSSVVTSITRLPRILVVQLKRYEYNPEQGESVKRSWKVPVTRWLHLDKYVSDGTSPPTWNPLSGVGGSSVPKTNKHITLTVRNLSSELNVCEGKKEQEEAPPACSPNLKCPEGAAAVPTDKEDDELQEVMRRSMDDIEGTREEDEIQQAIRLSLQDLGMSYAHENQTQVIEDQMENEERDSVEGEEKDKDEDTNSTHSFRLISVISHFGCTTNTGHYVPDVYNCEESSWFHYDDETVSKISESVVLAEGRQKNGYIFFYVHKDVFMDMEKKVSLQR